MVEKERQAARVPMVMVGRVGCLEASADAVLREDLMANEDME